MPSRDRRRRWLSIIAFPALLAALAALAVAFRSELFGMFRSAEAIRAWTDARGPLAPLAFVGLQVIQVIVFVIPGEIVQIAGGFVFGPWGGTLWSVAGILLGSLFNFSMGRLLGRPFVLATLGTERAERVEAATAGDKARAGFFLLFAIPGIPKDALCYAAGASRLSLASFIVISTIGRLPGIVGSACLGSAVFENDFRAAIAILSAASVLFFLGLAFRGRLRDAADRILSGRGRGEPPR